MCSKGIQLADAESVWFFKQKLSLGEVQKCPPSASETYYAECEREALSLLKRPHMTGVGAPPSSLAPWKRPQPRPGSGKGTSWRRPSSSSSSASASTGASGWSAGSTRTSLGASAVNAAEVDGYEMEEQEADVYG